MWPLSYSLSRVSKLSCKFALTYCGYGALCLVGARQVCPGRFPLEVADWCTSLEPCETALARCIHTLCASGSCLPDAFQLFSASNCWELGSVWDLVQGSYHSLCACLLQWSLTSMTGNMRPLPRSEVPRLLRALGRPLTDAEPACMSWFGQSVAYQLLARKAWALVFLLIQDMSNFFNLKLSGQAALLHQPLQTWVRMNTTNSLHCQIRVRCRAVGEVHHRLNANAKAASESSQAESKKRELAHTASVLQPSGKPST